MPPEHWHCIKDNNPLERLMREIRRRTRVVIAFPDGKSALILVTTRLRRVAATNWGTKLYLQSNRMAEVVAIARASQPPINNPPESRLIQKVRINRALPGIHM
jgi:transposase-like protein